MPSHLCLDEKTSRVNTHLPLSLIFTQILISSQLHGVWYSAITCFDVRSCWDRKPIHQKVSSPLRQKPVYSSDIKACFIFVVGGPELEVLSIQGFQSWFICHVCTDLLPHLVLRSRASLRCRVGSLPLWQDMAWFMSKEAL